MREQARVQNNRTEMIRKKWKIVNVVQVNEKTYWEIDTEILDLTHLSESRKASTGMYLAHYDGRDLIKIDRSNFYYEILKLSERELKIGLHGKNPATDQNHLMMIIECITA